MSTISNVSAVTLREFRTRAFSRTFVVATALLIVSVVAIALAPVILRFIDRTDTQRIAVWTDAGDLGIDPASSISVLLNARSITNAATFKSPDCRNAPPCPENALQPKNAPEIANRPAPCAPSGKRPVCDARYAACASRLSG